MEYIIRENSIDSIKPNFEGRLLSDVLKNDYGYIYESMKADNYEIRFEPYSLFLELVDDSKVVGFVTFYVPQPSSMNLTETYVLPGFESKNLLLNSFLSLLGSGSTISIVEPTRDIIDFLIANNFAAKITDSLVTSAVTFDMMPEDMEGNYHLSGVVPSTTLYDLNLCSPIFLHNISTPGVCEIFYLKVNPADDKKYNASKFRKSVDIDEYLWNIKEEFLENGDEFNSVLYDLMDSLPRSSLDYNEIIGEGDELSDYFEGMIVDGIADRETAVKIRNQLKREYENEEVTDDGLAMRVTFLLTEDEHGVNTDTFDDVSEPFDTFCPYCHSQVSVAHDYCHTCGYNLLKSGMLTVKDIKR